LRSGTAARICPADYDVQRQEISFRTKFGDAQTLPVTDELAALFAIAPGRPAPYVSQLHPRGHISLAALRQSVQRLRAAVGIEKRIIPHDLRRTTAVRTLEITQDLRVVQALLGHRALQQTLHYLDHRMTPVSRETLELAKLNAAKEQL
jgi:integrase